MLSQYLLSLRICVPECNVFTEAVGIFYSCKKLENGRIFIRTSCMLFRSRQLPSCLFWISAFSQVLKAILNFWKYRRKTTKVGKNAESVGENPALWALASCSPCVTSLLRNKIRKTKKIEGRYLTDLLLHLCCFCCVLSQGGIHKFYKVDSSHFYLVL